MHVFHSLGPRFANVELISESRLETTIGPMSIVLRILKGHQVAAPFNVFMIQSWYKRHDLWPHNCHYFSINETYVRQI